MEWWPSEVKSSINSKRWCIVVKNVGFRKVHSSSITHMMSNLEVAHHVNQLALSPLTNKKLYTEIIRKLSFKSHLERFFLAEFQEAKKSFCLETASTKPDRERKSRLLEFTWTDINVPWTSDRASPSFQPSLKPTASQKFCKRMDLPETNSEMRDILIPRKNLTSMKSSTIPSLQLSTVTTMWKEHWLWRCLEEWRNWSKGLTGLGEISMLCSWVIQE